MVSDTNVARCCGFESQPPLNLSGIFRTRYEKGLSCIHTSSPNGSRVRGCVRVYNISRALNHPLKLLVKLVPWQRWMTRKKTDSHWCLHRFLGHFEPEVGELNPQKANLYQDSCKWLKDIYLKKIPRWRIWFFSFGLETKLVNQWLLIYVVDLICRCNLCIYSGFEQLWFDESADRFHSRCLTFPCRGSQHGSQEGYVYLNFF